MIFHINIQQGLTYSISLLLKQFYINIAVSAVKPVIQQLLWVQGDSSLTDRANEG